MFVSRNKVYAVFSSLLTIPFTLLITQVVLTGKLKDGTGDIENYIAGYDRYVQYLAYRSETWLDYITNEVAFHLLYFQTSVFFDDPLAAFQVLSGLASIITLLAIIPQNRTQIVFLLFLLHPRVLDLLSSQVRFALAISIFILVLRFVKSRFRALFLVPLATIHTFFLAAASFVFVFDRYLARRKGTTVYILTAAISVVFVFGADYVLSLLGDRRALATETNKSFGFFYLIMMVFTYASIIYTNKKIVFDIFGFLFVLTAFFGVLTSFIGGYAERFVSASILFFLAYVSRNTIKSPHFVFLVLFGNFTLSMLYWI